MTTINLEKDKTKIEYVYDAELHGKTAKENVEEVLKALKIPAKTNKILKAKIRVEIQYAKPSQDKKKNTMSCK